MAADLYRLTYHRAWPENADGIERQYHADARYWLERALWITLNRDAQAVREKK